MIIFYLTDKKRLSLFLCVILSVLCLWGKEPVFAEEEAPENLYSRSCALMDGDSGRVLYGKEEKTPMANASTTKIMTCILALEKGGMDDTVTASKRAASQPKVHLGMQEGEQFYLKDLLYAMMLESYNDCAVAIAEQIAGSVEEFAVLMNEKAKELGCLDTHFITPNGLDESDGESFHHTTAEDLCRIMRYCAWESPKAEEFLTVTQAEAYGFQSLSGRNFSVSNHNAFLHMMDGVISGKTGFTADAGYCYVAALESDGRKYCIALLACGWPNNKTYKWSDAKALFSYGLEQYRYQKLELSQELPQISVLNARPSDASLSDWGSSMSIEPQMELPKTLRQEYLLKDSEQLTCEMQITKQLPAPVQQEEQVGKLCFYLNQEPIAEIPVYAGSRLEAWDFPSLFFCLVKHWMMI